MTCTAEPSRITSGMPERASVPAIPHPRAATDNTAGLDPGTVAGALAGDPRSVESLLQALRPILTRYFRTRLSAPVRRLFNVDDLTQEVLFATYRALPKFTHPPEALMPYVYRIAANKLADAHRASVKDRSVQLDPDTEAVLRVDEPNPAEQFETRELHTRLDGLLERLTPLQRSVIVLRVLRGYSATETADKLNLPSPGAVRVAQHRALATLRQHGAATRIP